LISFTVAYFTEESLDWVRSIEDIPQLAALHVPHGKYKSARSAKGRPDHIFNPETEDSEFSCLEYVSYAPNPRSAPRNLEPPATKSQFGNDNTKRIMIMYYSHKS